MACRLTTVGGFNSTRLTGCASTSGRRSATVEVPKATYVERFTSSFPNVLLKGASATMTAVVPSAEPTNVVPDTGSIAAASGVPSAGRRLLITPKVVPLRRLIHPSMATVANPPSSIEMSWVIGARASCWVPFAPKSDRACQRGAVEELDGAVPLAHRETAAVGEELEGGARRGQRDPPEGCEPGVADAPGRELVVVPDRGHDLAVGADRGGVHARAVRRHGRPDRLVRGGRPEAELSSLVADGQEVPRVLRTDRGPTRTRRQ